MICRPLRLPRSGRLPAESELVARFDWTEYEQLMIFGSRAPRRDRLQTSRCASIRKAHACGRFSVGPQCSSRMRHGHCSSPEDNSAASTAEFVEAALASAQTQELIAQRCRIPAIVSDLRIERAATLHSPEQPNCLAISLTRAAAGGPSQAAELSAEVETPSTSRRRRRSLKTLCGSMPPVSMRPRNPWRTDYREIHADLGRSSSLTSATPETRFAPNFPTP